jgi:hypothetical protein
MVGKQIQLFEPVFRHINFQRCFQDRINHSYAKDVTVQL